MHLNPVALAVTFIGILMPIVTPSSNPAVERVLAWCGLLIACVAGFFVLAPLNWKSGIGFSAIVIFAMLRNSSMRRMLTFRSKTHDDDVSDSLADPSPDDAPRPRSDNPDYDPDA